MTSPHGTKPNNMERQESISNAETAASTEGVVGIVVYRLVQLWRWVWPDTAQITRGSLWLAKRRFYVDRWSCHDLKEVDEVCSSGVVFITCGDHREDWDPFPEIIKPRGPSMCVMRGELCRTHQLVSRDEAAALGFELNAPVLAHADTKTPTP